MVDMASPLRTEYYEVLVSAARPRLRLTLILRALPSTFKLFVKCATQLCSDVRVSWTMIDQSDFIVFCQTANSEGSLAFYRDVIGIHLLEDSPFALVFQGSNAVLRVQKVSAFTPQPFTVLGWQVANIERALDELAAGGVRSERFEGMVQDEAGIWQSSSGARICWFKDPDGNLSLTQSLA